MAAGLAVEMVYSSNRDLDILPAGVNKGSASRYLASYWDIPSQRIAVAGDTGNDESMFLQGFRGIVVDNAQEELKAMSSPDIYQSRETFADGVIDGIAHWFGKTNALFAAS
jgi:hydroxymethylpyrimidine pyrophosphatase-like HAD family hydrolase